MIIFYYKETGQIQGKIDGRVHDEHKDMYHGESPDELGRLEINWFPIAFYDKDGNLLDSQMVIEKFADPENPTKLYEERCFASDWEPNHPQKDLMVDLEVKKVNVYDYEVYTDPNSDVPLLRLKQPVAG